MFKSIARVLLLIPILLGSVFAATTSTSINSSSYTQILGPGGAGYLLSAYQPMQCLFKTTLPSPSTVGHLIQQQQQTSIDSIGTGVYLWCKSSAAGLNYATTTPAADAGTWGNGGAGSSTSNVNLAQVGGSTYGLGQTTMSASMPVVLPSNQSAIPVTESGTWNITNITGTVSLPTGASTNVGITGAGSKTLSDINTTLGTPLQAGGNVVVTSAPTTAVTNAGLTNIDVALSTRLKPADTLAAVTTVGTITNPVAVTGTFWQATQPVSGTVSAAQSGTWTIQPGNTANTTPWLVTNAPGATGVAANSPSQCESTAYEASHVCKASAGVIYRMVIYNAKTSAQFFQIFNSTSVPADTAVPVTAPVNCPASSNCTYDFGAFGYAMSTGISVSNSSTGPTKTIGSADSWFSVSYK